LDQERSRGRPIDITVECRCPAPWIVPDADRIGNDPAQQRRTTMQARISNPAIAAPELLKALHAVGSCARKGGVPARTLDLVHLRASQINGCGVCVDMHARDLKKSGESDERLFALAAWRDAVWFTDAERAALDLAEAATRLNDRSDPVPDAIWNEAARHYDEPALANLVVNIALINFWNRINVTTRQIAGSAPR
jgi:AhpD family alkylhydroperoxidase